MIYKLKGIPSNITLCPHTEGPRSSLPSLIDEGKDCEIDTVDSACGTRQPEISVGPRGDLNFSGEQFAGRGYAKGSGERDFFFDDLNNVFFSPGEGL